nr:amidohydrolase family protein [Anaerolineae bacterium]
MQHIDTILKNGTIVTMDKSYALIEDGAIAIQHDTIIAVNTTRKIIKHYSADNEVDCTSLTIIPGLVNAHTHIPMTLLRGLADDLRLDVWLLGYMMPVEREYVTPEFVELGTLLGCAEMIQSGVTTFADMYYFEECVAAATASAGMRGVCGQTILKFPAPDAESFEAGLARCRSFLEQWHDHPLIIPAVAPHAPYTTTDDLLKSAVKLAQEFDVPLHIHLSETAEEVENSLDEHGVRVIPYVDSIKLFKAKTIAAHCVHIDAREVGTLAAKRVGVAHNPTSNLKLASGIAPVTEMLKAGISVGIGTDGAASNNDLDMFEETRLAALLAKTESDDPTSLPARQALEMATILGAKALHIDHLTGSIEAGKRADLAFLDLNRHHVLPHFNRVSEAVYSRIVYAAKSTDVLHVMCNGQWLMRDRELLTIDTDHLHRQAQQMAADIDTFLKAREEDILSKLLAIGELQQEESFEVQVKARLSDPAVVHHLLERPDVTIAKKSHYRQHDTYLSFEDSDYRLRYREDDYISADNRLTNVRSRLTLTESGKEREFENAVVLSRSRYIAQATRPLRFYREYLQAAEEHTIVKDRERWHVDYQGLRLYINLDKLRSPSSDGYFIELKSRTWSLRDAEQKATVISRLLSYLGIAPSELIRSDYFDITN